MIKFKIHNWDWYIFTKRDLKIDLILLILGYIFGRWEGVFLVFILNLFLIGILGWIRSGENARKINIILKILIEKKLITTQDAKLITNAEKPLTME